ncbi:MAG: PorP/SprF family type IX secretion system membrane protein, partial [Bacteroidota bacterium]
MSTIIGQDVQFSQFYSNPLYLNPALTGSHSGTYRVVANYRDQWRSTLEQPFSTFSVTGDLKFNLPSKGGSYKQGNDKAAAGVQFFSDRVGLVEFNTNQLNFFGAYHKKVGRENQYLSAGVQFGIAQRGILYENLDFGDEFDGATEFRLPSGETLPSNSLAYNDMALGLHYSASPDVDRSFYLGVSMHHWNQPSIGLYATDMRLTEFYDQEVLATKWSLHGGASFLLNNVTVLQPRGVFISQGTNSTFVLGSNLKYRFIDSNGVALHLGAWLRATDNLTTFQPTDVILSAAYELNGLLVGLSYDATLRTFTGSTLGQGIIEFSVAYVGEHDNEYEICPQ